MAKMTVLQYPDERLRKVAQKIEKVDDNIRSVIDDMFETMYEEQGVGLAATQVDVHRRLFVSDCSEDQTNRWCSLTRKLPKRKATLRTMKAVCRFPAFTQKLNALRKLQ